MAGSASISINPIPVNGATINPAALQVYEFAYTQSNGQQRYIPFVSTETFRRYTAGYTQLLGASSSFPDVVCQIFQRRVILMYPALATTGDTVQLTICPDPASTGTIVTCANGGLMVNDADVPLIPPQFHPALVEGAVMQIARDLDKDMIYKQAVEQWMALTQEAIDFGSSVAEGDSEQRVIDTWQTTFDSQANVM